MRGTDVLVSVPLVTDIRVRSRHCLSLPVTAAWRRLIPMTRLPVRVTPRASRDSVEGFDAEGVLRLRVTAPPAGGEANAAVVKLLSRALGLPSRDVVLVSGGTARQKLFEVPLSEAEARLRLERPGPADALE